MFVDVERQEQIISCTASQLLTGMRIGELTSTEIVTVYALRAMAVGALTNNVAEEFYKEAFEQAQIVDVNINTYNHYNIHC